MSEMTLEDLNEIEEDALPTEVSLKTGVNVGDVPQFSKKDQDTRPNAVRWVFNPGVAIVDLTNEPAANSVPFLNAVTFNKIQSIPTKQQRHKTFDLEMVPGPGGEDASYDRVDRTSYQQAKDLIDKHSEKGVQIPQEMFDLSETDAAELNTLLFGSEIPCRPDPNNERFPVPVLPNLLEVLHRNATAAIREAKANGDTEDAALIKAVAEQTRDAIGRGIKWARTSIKNAQERFLDEKNPNRKFSEAEERCYLALGEEVPDQMPLMTKGHAASQGAVSVDSEAIGRGIAAGFAAAGVTPGAAAPAAPEPSAPEAIAAGVSQKAEDAFTKVDFSVTEEDLASAEKREPTIG